jgi:multidrug transporter EmrE-like cation transporter
VIAFPIASAGGLALAVLGGRVFWKERLNGRTGAGIALALGAAALVNVR